MAEDRPIGAKSNQGSIPKRSFAQIIRGLKPNPRLLSSSVETLVPTMSTIMSELEVYKGEPSFLLSKEEDDRLAIPFRLALVGKLAGIIGKPLKIDVPTLNMSRPSVARVCVEVDLLKDLPKQIRLGVEGNTYFQAVTYENLPEYCTECSKIGHSVKNCKHTKEWKSEVGDTTEAGNKKQTANVNNLVVKIATEKLRIIPKEAQKQTKHVWKPKSSVLQENEMEKTKDHHGPSTSGLSTEEKQNIPVDVMERSPLIQIPKKTFSPQRAVFYQTIATSSRFEVLPDLDNPVTGDTEVDANLQEAIESDVESDEGMITEKEGKKANYFRHLLDNVDARLSNWKNKLLSAGGRLLLIRHVLSAIPMHTFSAIEPPKMILEALERRCQNFLWGMKEDVAHRHWKAWRKLTFLTAENGLGLQKFQDNVDASRLSSGGNGSVTKAFG
ncbi:OLC1v1012692C1 [Oldenlandia corymbosa var. corymbosa]|uniref:OLC1v1012692C1 n=1 Tax=Oldenlandia corymbosa var. corymbosa TaxID=529605 RepID=A0AAV1DWS3_OLDCO|nr:OLC1v1012692C1 [Oldenlandia corymbosa var. corymbosa]